MSRITDRIQEFTRPTGEEALMAVEYPKPRLRIGVKEAALVAGVLVAVLVAWLLLRGGGPEAGDGAAAASGSEPPAEVLEAVAAERGGAGAGSTGGQQATGAAAPGTGTEQEPEEVVVSVVGEVAHPGLVTLTPGSRVADALEVAEPLPGAELLPLNRAQKLSDGEQILVPAEGEELPASAAQQPLAAGGSAGADAGVVSLNHADAAELTELNGVGEATAAAIISHREEIGGFTAVEQLRDVKGIGPVKFADLEAQVGL